MAKIKKRKEKRLCSGYGVFPDGSKCPGCNDCKGRFVKKAATKKELKEVFDKNHAVVRVGKNFDLVNLLKSR